MIRSAHTALFLFALLLASERVAANVRLVPARAQPQGLIDDDAHIEIHGEITAADVAKIRPLIQTLRNKIPTYYPVPVFLNSPGGNVMAAMEIGRIIRGGLGLTVVNSKAECSSACIFLLASGVVRVVVGEGRLGLHRPRFDQKLFAGLSAADAQGLYARLVQKCRGFFSDMGMSDRLLEDMLRIGSHDVLYEDRLYAEEVLLAGDDPGFREWARAKEIEHSGERRVQASDRFLDCLNAGNAKKVCNAQYLQYLEESAN